MVFIADCLLMVDILFNFRTMYYDKWDRIVLHTDPFDIASHYFRGWFFIDLLTSFPLEFVFSMTNISIFVKIFRIFRFVRILKIVRIIRVTKTFDGFVKLAKERELVAASRLFKIMAYMLLTAHYFACLWWWVGKQLHDRDIPIRINRITGNADYSSWIQAQGIDPSTATLIEKYSASWYWAIVTLFTTGYGDITAHDVMEQWVSSFCIIIGSVFFAFFIGTLTSYLSGDADEEKRNERERVQQARLFCQHHKFDQEMTRTVLTHIRYHCKTNSVCSHEDIMPMLPHFVQAEINEKIAAKYLGDLDLFRNLPKEVIGQIALCMRSISCNRGKFLFRRGDVAKDIYIQRTGIAHLHDKHGFSRELRRGDVVGERALISGRRRLCVTTSMWTEFFSLNVDDIQNVFYRNFKPRRCLYELKRMKLMVKDHARLYRMNRRCSLEDEMSVTAVGLEREPPGAEGAHLHNERGAKVANLIDRMAAGLSTAASTKRLLNMMPMMVEVEVGDDQKVTDLNNVRTDSSQAPSYGVGAVNLQMAMEANDWNDVNVAALDLDDVDSGSPLGSNGLTEGDMDRLRQNASNAFLYSEHDNPAGGTSVYENAVEMAPMTTSSQHPNRADTENTAIRSPEKPKPPIDPDAAGALLVSRSLPTGKSSGLRVRVHEDHRVSKSMMEMVSPKPLRLKSLQHEHAGTWMSKFAPFETRHNSFRRDQRVLEHTMKTMAMFAPHNSEYDRKIRGMGQEDSGNMTWSDTNSMDRDEMTMERGSVELDSEHEHSRDNHLMRALHASSGSHHAPRRLSGGGARDRTMKMGKFAGHKPRTGPRAKSSGMRRVQYSPTLSGFMLSYAHRQKSSSVNKETTPAPPRDPPEPELDLEPEPERALRKMREYEQYRRHSGNMVHQLDKRVSLLEQDEAHCVQDLMSSEEQVRSPQFGSQIDLSLIKEKQSQDVSVIYVGKSNSTMTRNAHPTVLMDEKSTELNDDEEQSDGENECPEQQDADTDRFQE